LLTDALAVFLEVGFAAAFIAGFAGVL
jgi:hypothetical protein